MNDQIELKKQSFLAKRDALADALNGNTSHETIVFLAKRAIQEMKEWHSLRFPGKKFRPPTVSKMISNARMHQSL